jgi:hypothetical protein
METQATYNLFVRKEYQVKSESGQEKMPSAVREFLSGLFPKNINFNKVYFSFEYQGRRYDGKIVHFGRYNRHTGGFPQEVYQGSIDILVRFPNENGANRRVRNKLQSFSLPYVSIDMGI